MKCIDLSDSDNCNKCSVDHFDEKSECPFTNTNLVQAAPDLLAACETITKVFDNMFSQCCSNGLFDSLGRPVNCCALNMANLEATKAIAKARGEK